MIRLLLFLVLLVSLSYYLTWAFQIETSIFYSDNSYLEFFKKIFSSLDSVFNIKKVEIPNDTANIYIPVYPPIPVKEITGDYLHRIGAEEAWKRGDYEGIIDSLKLVKNLNNVDYRLLANSYYRLGNLDSALAVGEKIKNPDESTLYALGLFAMTLRKYSNALKHFRDAINKKPDLINALIRLGDVYYVMNDHKNALNYWLEAKKYGCNEPYINYFVGSIYFEIGDLDNASKYFAQLDGFKDEKDWFIRAKYFQALIQEHKGSRESALEILSEIEIRAIGMSKIEYDILKKKIYSHFWLGIKNYNENPKVALEHFINSEVLISINSIIFSGDDKIVVDLLKGVLQRLSENIKAIKKHTLSSQHFHSYTETWLNTDRKNEMNRDLMRVSAEILFHCQEPILSARFFNQLKNEDRIAEMNYYILKPNDMQQLPDMLSIATRDTLTPYMIFNYMGVSYQKGDYQAAEKLFHDLLGSLNTYSTIKNKNSLKYAALFYRSRWLHRIYREDQSEILLKELENINNTLNDMRIKIPKIALPNYFYLPNGKLFIMSVKRS